MDRQLTSFVVLGLVFGCGSATQSPAMRASMPLATDFEIEGEALAGASSTPVEVVEVDANLLPVAPWTEAPIAEIEAPAQLVGAWQRAENRDWCAPMAPRSFGAADGARARRTNIEGGWAVEFDRMGMPGVSRDGTPCEACGRGVFGIAGTSLTPDELVDVESEAMSPAPSFNDGSHAAIESSDGETVAAATIVVQGQGCVYQVWSFLGREHVQELVSELRRVDMEPRAATLARAGTRATRP